MIIMTSTACCLEMNPSTLLNGFWQLLAQLGLVAKVFLCEDPSLSAFHSTSVSISRGISMLCPATKPPPSNTNRKTNDNVSALNISTNC